MRRSRAVRGRDLELVARVPRPSSGTNSSQMPEAPSERIGCRRPSQLLKSPTTLTRGRSGAQTANVVPATPVDLADVRAELSVELLVAALARQMQVELARASAGKRTGHGG